MSRGAFVGVFGISGVGKTTLIRQFVAQHSGWRALVASELLSERLRTDPERLRTADRRRIEANQDVVAEQLRELRTRHPEQNWLLDAHAVINNDIELVTVPLHVIARLEPTALVFVQDHPAAILRRRQLDPVRSRPESSADLMKVEQDLAIETCLGYSAALKLPLKRVNTGDDVAFAAAVEVHEPFSMG